LRDGQLILSRQRGDAIQDTQRHIEPLSTCDRVQLPPHDVAWQASIGS
jgi:hypothetical protein